MSIKYTFRLKSEEKSKRLPHKLLIAESITGTKDHVLLKLLGYILFFRERLQIETNLHMDTIPFVPDLVELDYTLKPVLWVECGECSVTKLNKLAVKVNEADIWILLTSAFHLESLYRDMEKHGLRRHRYHLLGFNAEMIEEMLELLRERNELNWFRGTFDPPQLQFDFNGLWFDCAFDVLRF